MPLDVEPKKLEAPGEAARPAPPRFPTPQLRIHDGQVYIGFGATPLTHGLVVSDLALLAPDVTFPFDIAGSAATRYQKRKCRFGYLEIELNAEHLHRAVHKVHKACADHIATLQLHLRKSGFEAEGKLHDPKGPIPFTLRIGFQPEGTTVVAYAYDVRLYGPSSVAAPQLAALVARGALAAAVVPESHAVGAAGVGFDPVPQLLRRAVPLRGFRLPDTTDARVATVEATHEVLRVRFAAGARPDLLLDEALLSTVEGTRSFGPGEDALARGDRAQAEAYYLKEGERADAHPFAQERLLGLLAARPDAHDLALDVARSLRKSHPGVAAGWWAEAGIRLRRGDPKTAGELYAQLGRIARDKGEETSAFHALSAAGEALLEPAPALAVRCLEEALVLRPDDMRSLTALARAADLAGHEESVLRACRRIAALARDPAQAARAHVRLAESLVKVGRDRAAARLHLDAALRILPDDPEALLGTARLCREDGEYLRALRCLDQVRDIARQTQDAPLEAQAHRLSGEVWDEGLRHLPNALLRYQEAARLAPADCDAHVRLASVYERLGRNAEALETYRQAAVLAEARPRSEASRKAAHAAYRALARVTHQRLGDALAARKHYEAALALEPNDVDAMAALLPAFREAGKWPELARACEACAAHTADLAERARLLVEAADVLASRLSEVAKAERLLEQALLTDPASREALSRIAELAEQRGDGRSLCRYLLRLVESAPTREEKAVALRRLGGAARDLGDDLDLAADALSRALDLEPGDLDTRLALVEVQRRRGDAANLADALGGLGRALELEGNFARAASALRERARILESAFGRSDDAIAALEHALALAPHDAEVLADLGDLSLKHGRPSAARQAYRSLAEALGPKAEPSKIAELHGRMGRASEALGDKAGALEAFATAFRLNSSDDAVADRLAALLSGEGRLQEQADLHFARGQAKRKAEQRSAASGQLRLAGDLYQRLGQAPEARAAYEAVLEVEPDGPAALAALEALAAAALESRDPARAAKLLARQAAFQTDARVAARKLYHAAALIKESDSAQFVSLLLSAAKRDGLFPPARATLAYLRFNEQAYEDALGHAGNALTDPKDPDALAPREQTALHKLAASAAQKLGDVERGRIHLAAYCEATPGDLDALTELAGLQRRAGASAELAATLSRLAAKLEGKAAAAALRERGEALAGLPKRQEEAVDAFRQALTIDPGDAAALRGLARTLDQPEDSRERARLLQRAASLCTEPHETYRLYMECGRAFDASGEPAEAARAFERAALLASDPVEALESLADSARAAGSVDLELDALTRRAAVAQERGELDAAERHLSLGLRQLQQGRQDQAIVTLGRVARLDPTPAVERDAITALVDVLESRGELQEAAAQLTRLAQLLKGSERAAALLRRAEHLQAASDLTAARDSLEEALKASPGDRRVIGLLHEICAGLSDWHGQAEALEAYLALPQPDRRAAARAAAELGEVFLRKLRDPARAEVALRKALTFDRGIAGASRSLFDALLELGRIEEALPLGEKLGERLDPREAAPWFRMLCERARDELGDAGFTLRFARRAVQLDPDHPAGLQRLADALYVGGSRAEAAPLYRLLVETGAAEDREVFLEQRLRLAELTLEAGELKRAVSTLQATLAKEPTSAAVADLLFGALLPSDPEAAVLAMARHARALTPGSRALSLFRMLADVARTRLSAHSMAAEFLEAARTLSSDAVGIDLELASARREAGDPVALAQALRRGAAGALASGDLERALPALEELAAVLERLKDPVGAAGALGQAAEALVQRRKSAEGARRFRRRALLLRDQARQPEAAEASFRRAFELDRSDKASAEDAAALCHERGDFSAEAELTEALAGSLPAGREQAEALRDCAALQLELGDNARACELLERALSEQPDLDDAREELERVLALEGRHAEIAQSLESRATRASDPASRAALLVRAAKLWQAQAQRPDEAARLIAQARALTPSDVELADWHAQLLAEAGKAGETAEVDAQILARDPLHPAAFERRLAHLRARGDRDGEATLLESRASHAEPKAASQLLLDAAALRLGLGDDGGAAQDERRAFDLDPENEQAFTRLVARVSGEGPEVLTNLLLKRAQAVPGEAFSLHRARAQVLADAGSQAAAAAALDEALALQPTDPESLSLRADLAEAVGGLGAAEPFDVRLLEAQKKGAQVPRANAAQAHYRIGLATHARGDARAAAEHLEGAFELDPKNERAVEALRLLADFYEWTGQKPAMYRICMAQAWRLPSEPERALALRHALEVAPDAAAERAALEQLAQLGTADAALLSRLARSLGAAGRYADQVATFERAAAAEPDDAAAARLLLEAANVAGTQLSDGLTRSKALRGKALQRAPGSAEALQASLVDLRESGDAKALAKALEQVAASAGDSNAAVEAHLERAQVLEAAGDRASAADAYLAVARSPAPAGTCAEAHRHAARLLKLLGRFAEAADSLAALATTEQGAHAAATLLEASGLYEALDSARAFALAEKAAKADPASPEPYLALARLHQAEGRAFDSARALARAAAATQGPDRALRFLQAGNELKAQGQSVDAAEAFESALASGIDSPELREALAEAYEEHGRKDRALPHLRTAAERATDPDRRSALGQRTARLAEELGAHDEARAAWETALAQRPDDDEAYRGLRAVLERNADASALLALLARRAPVLAKRSDAEGLLELHRERGRLALELKREPEAEAAYREVLGLDAQDSDARAALRRIAEARGDWAALARNLEDEAKAAKGAERCECFLSLGRHCLERMADPRRAADAFDQARALAVELGDDARAQAAESALIQALLSAGEAARAAALLDQRLAAAPDEVNLELRRQAADACLLAGDRAGARRHLLAALAADPTQELLDAFEAASSGATSAERAGALEARLRLSPPSARAGLYRSLADLRREQGDLASETAALRGALESDPSSADVLERLVAAYEQKQDWAALKSLLANRAGRAPDLEQKALLFARLGELLASKLADPAAAVDAFRQALDAAPSLSRAAAGLVDAWWAHSSGEDPHALYTALGSGRAAAAIPSIALSLGTRCEKEGRHANALHHYERAANVDGAAPAALEGLLRAAEAAGDKEKALSASLTLLGQREGAAAAPLHAKVAALMLERGKLDEALEHLEGTGGHAPPELFEKLRERFVAEGRYPWAARAVLAHALVAPAAAPFLEAARLYEQAGDAQEAASAVDRGLVAVPNDLALLAKRCEIAAADSDYASLTVTALRLEAAGGHDKIDAFLRPLARGLEASGRGADALRRLREALARAFDPELATEARSLAERLKDTAAQRELSALLAQHEAGRRSEQTAESLSQVDTPQLSDADLELQAELFSREPAAASQAVAIFSELARRMPQSTERQQRLLAAVQGAGDAEWAKLLKTLPAAGEPPASRAFPDLTRVCVTDSVRHAIYDPLALSPIARLFGSFAQALGQALEPRLPPRGYADWDRIGPTHAPVIAGRVRQAQTAVQLEALHAYLLAESNVLGLDPGSPDRLLVGLGASMRFDGAAMAYHLVRLCELSRLGAAAPLFAGPQGLPAMVGSVLAAMGLDAGNADPGLAEVLRASIGVPDEELLALGRMALEQLSTLDPAAYLDALERSAGRVALLVCADASAALRAQALASPELAEADPSLFDAASYLQTPAALELVGTCLRDDLGSLRRSCVAPELG